MEADKEHVMNKGVWMLLARITIIIPRWLELSLDKWTLWVEGVCIWVYISMQRGVKNEQLLERKRKNVIQREISYSKGTEFLISLGCNWLGTPLPTRHQWGSCQSKTSGQTLATPSPRLAIIYLCLDTRMHKSTLFPFESPTQIPTFSHLSGGIITFDLRQPNRY